MASFGETLRHLMAERGVSLGRLAELASFDKGYLSKIANGKKLPSAAVAKACDAALGARGELMSAAHLDIAAARDSQPWQTADLLLRIQSSDTSASTLEALDSTIFELCCQYPYRDATDLRRESQEWLRHVVTLLHRPVGLQQHRDLLVAAGRLALLIGCVEYDMGMRAGAESTRVAARQLAHEAGNAEILAWTHEMRAWFALTQGRYGRVVTEANAGIMIAHSESVTVQLLAQRAKAYARLGDIEAVRSALDEGADLLSVLPRPDRPDHHFVVDPDKWDFYAMDAYRLAGADELAATHARQVIARSQRPHGVEVSPMRAAEARLTLGVVAARTGNLEDALAKGAEALSGDRRSLPSLVMVASELESALHERYPGELRTEEFTDRLRSAMC
ncbi:hypothetical protein Lfu02_12770 [Longispora fulva]|uniref:Transcriptional regulator with XRE-family HTH domain n=1 Tax=Longispora fulva TaxID=619741 RepID=A0A8J7GN88_9ACTN|nr:helix-turn-helix transcriptional regulator [Longispora fulva]MBG6134863.1 transcriptional regulator with XRE-family HTH domain [Longispora fulva]GIG56905.1 hypothetical protein Lfu02_12770 [Longispora fulva]